MREAFRTHHFPKRMDPCWAEGLALWERVLGQLFLLSDSILVTFLFICTRMHILYHLTHLVIYPCIHLSILIEVIWEILSLEKLHRYKMFFISYPILQEIQTIIKIFKSAISLVWETPSVEKSFYWYK